MNRKQIIAITVLGIAALMLGCKPKPTPAEPKPISEKDIVGTYEYKDGANTFRHVFLDNGMMVGYLSGEKVNIDYKWSIVDNEIHVENPNFKVTVWRLNPDNSITFLVDISDGKRTDIPKERQFTFKKIN